MGAVSTSLHSSWYSLTHRLIDVAFQCRILGVSSLELLHDIRLMKVVIYNVDNRYNVATRSVYLSIGKIANLHCESSTEAPTSNESTLFVVRSADAPFL